MRALTKLHVKMSSAKRDGKRYSYFMATIPSRIVRSLGWQANDPLELEIKEVDGKKGVFIRKLE